GHVRSLALALSSPPRRERLERATEVDSGLLVNLLADLVPPDEPRLSLRVEPRLGRALPGVESIDQVEAGPRDRSFWLILFGLECVQDEAQALIEGEPGGAHVAAERCSLLRRRVEREAERRLSSHARHPESAITNVAVATTPTYDASVFSYRVATRRKPFSRPNHLSITL